MRRPIPRLILQKYGNNISTEQSGNISQASLDYADKLKLATSLHEQGVDPIRWQEAEPAPYAAQRLYRETRQAPEDMFVAQDRLYRRSPAIAATPDQCGLLIALAVIYGRFGTESELDRATEADFLGADVRIDAGSVPDQVCQLIIERVPR